MLLLFLVGNFLSTREDLSEMAEALQSFRAKDCACYEHNSILCLHCGVYVKKANRLPFKQFHQDNWEEEYNEVPDLTYKYKPDIICSACAKYLERRKNGKAKRKYLAPAIFRKPLKQHSNCLIKLVYEQVKNNLAIMRKPEKIVYPEDSNLIKPVPNIVRDEEDADQVPEAFEINQDEEDITSFSELYLEDSEDEDYVPDQPRPVKKQVAERKTITQEQANDLIRILNLSGDHAEVLGSFLKRFAYTELKFRITSFRTRMVEVKQFFKSFGKCVVLYDIEGFVYHLRLVICGIFY